MACPFSRNKTSWNQEFHESLKNLQKNLIAEYGEPIKVNPFAKKQDVIPYKGDHVW